MATARQLERFFEGTGVRMESFQQGRDGFIHLTVSGKELTILADVMPNRAGEMTNPKLVIRYSQRGA